MFSATRALARPIGVAVRAMILATLILGVCYTALITGIGQLALGWQANGSSVRGSDGAVVGSALLGQSFLGADGAPLPRYFQPRPSVAGDGYDGAASSGSNLGPENPKLVEAIRQRRAQVAEFNGVSVDAVPPDAVTASSSGLDPDISPAYALLQADRVAESRGLAPATVRDLVAAHTRAPFLGYLGESHVNVLELNLALDKLEG